MSFRSLLIHLVTITRITVGITSQERTGTSSTVASAVPCRIEQLSGSLQATILARIPKATHRVFFLAGQDVKTNDIANDGTSDYFIHEVNKVIGGTAESHREAIAELKL
jgi:hypothetical protein